MKFVWAVSALLLVSACSTPLEQCVDRATSQYQDLLAAISVARGNIDRGYALHKTRVSYTYPGTCRSEALGRYTCPKTGYRMQETPVAIDVAEERRKLAQFEKRVIPYRRAAEKGATTCKAQFPEDS